MRLVGILILLASVVAVGTLLLSPADGTPPAQGEPRNAAAVARNPRTTAYQKSINKGTEWLRSMIRIDGAVGTDRGMPPDLGCTAITGLVLLSQGNTPRSGPDRKKLERVLDWVLGTIERLPEGPDPDRPYTQIQRKIGRNADLFLTALFLSQVLGESIDAESEVRHSLQKVVKIVCLAQKEDGTWGEQSWAPILGTVLGWECLRASASSGMLVPASSSAAGAALLQRLKKATPDTEDWMHDFYKNASSIRVLHSMHYRDDPVFHDCVKKIFKAARGDPRVFTHAGGEEYLAFYFVTECMMQERNETWQAWYPLVAKNLAGNQNGDGSWTGHHCIRDRTFCTAAALLTLQTPILYLPTSDL